MVELNAILLFDCVEYNEQNNDNLMVFRPFRGLHVMSQCPVLGSICVLRNQCVILFNSKCEVAVLLRGNINTLLPSVDNEY